MGPPPDDDGEDDDDRRKAGAYWWNNRQALGILLAVALIAGGIGLAVALSGGKKSNNAAGEVFLQPASTTGANPFTPNTGHNVLASTVARTALAAAAPPRPSGALASYTGDTVGLYGGTRSTTSCNPQQMIGYLQANPIKAAAWAAAQGIPVSQLASYIGSLTPLTLRYDTRVTNHGFLNNLANPIPEILEAGQAVLVDHFGVPRARCYCGNPLTPPVAVPSTNYSGPQWPGFSPTTVVVVQQSTTIINNFTVIDTDSGDPFNRPAGTGGDSDGPANPAPGLPAMPGLNPAGTGTTTTAPPETTPPETSPSQTSPPETAPQATVPVTASNGQTLGTGAVQVTLTWSSIADLDLHVFEPDGTEIYYGNKNAADGGTQDVDANGGCNDTTSSPVENVFWANTPPSGTYTVKVAYYEECGSGGSGPQNYVVSVKVNGQIAQQQQGTISYTDGTPQQVLTYVVP